MSTVSKMNLLASLRASAAVELVADGGAVHYIEHLTPAERWKVYRDLEAFFGERANAIEKQMSVRPDIVYTRKENPGRIVA
jgi:hypothetical protein